MKHRGLVAAAAWAASAGAAFAQVAGSTTAPATAPASPAAGMLQGLIGLAIVVALIFATAWVLKRLGPRTRSGGLVRVVGGASVGPREKVVVVRYRDRTLLLGVAQGHVSLLHADDVPLEDAAAAGTSPVAPRFADRLRAARGLG